MNYAVSPAALHAHLDGSLNDKYTGFNEHVNRKMKMKDSFGTVFPAYNHGQVSTFDHINNTSEALG